MSQHLLYTIEIQRSAQKSLDKAPKNMKGRLVASINSLARDPRPVGCEKMSGFGNQWRVREGDWRIVYEIYDRHLEIVVVDVDTRDDVYRRR